MDQQQKPEEGSPIFLIPEIILEEKIFAFAGNLPNLALTCKYFNDLISNSRVLMKGFKLRIEEKPGKEPLSMMVPKVLKSKRKYSCFHFEKINCSDLIYSELIQRFKDSITVIWFWQCSLDSLTLADTYKAIGGLEELYLFYNTYSLSAAGSQVDFSKFEKLKYVLIKSFGDISVMDCLPETEKLKMELDELDSSNGDRIKQYLETHTELTKFSIAIGIYEGDYSQFPDTSINSKLVELEFGEYGDEDCPEYHFSNNLINFIKSQAKSLKQLKLWQFALNLNVAQNLLETLKLLESVEFNCSKFRRSSPFVAKNFTCPKLKKLKMDHIYDFPLFKKFPNLEELEIYNQPAVIVKAAAQHCPKIKKLVLWSFDRRPSNFFMPNLVDLKIYYDTIDQLDINFVLKHKKLERLELQSGKVNEVVLKTILQELADLKHLKISFKSSYKPKTAEYQRNCDANKEILRNIWPLLGHLKALVLSGDGLDKHAIYQEFPMIPGLTIFNTHW